MVAHLTNLSKISKESVQYNTALAITGAIRGSSRERLYQELRLELLNCACFSNLKKNK